MHHLVSRSNWTSLKRKLFLSCRVPHLTHVSSSNASILHDVLKVVKQYTSSSSMMALINARDRDTAITMLKERLSDTQRTILVSGLTTYYKVIAHLSNLALIGCRYISGSGSIHQLCWLA